MTEKRKIQALPQGRSTDEWLVRRTADVLEQLVDAIDVIHARLDEIDRRLAAVEQGSNQP